MPATVSYWTSIACLMFTAQNCSMAKDNTKDGIFNELKSFMLPNWDKLIGTLAFAEKKECPGVQVADLSIYGAYRQEMQEHGNTPTALEHSTLIASKTPDGEDIPSFRIPITREILASLKDDLFLREEERKKFWNNSRAHNE